MIRDLGDSILAGAETMPVVWARTMYSRDSTVPGNFDKGISSVTGQPDTWNSPIMDVPVSDTPKLISIRYVPISWMVWRI